MRSKRTLAISMLVLVLGLFLVPDMKGQNIIFSPDIVQSIENSQANRAFWSVIARDTTGNIVEGYNFDKTVRPASNLKLLTSAAVLDELGADYTYTTKMYGLGYQAGDVWQGDIIIRGVGDPTINGEFYEDDRLYVLEKFFSALHSRGIRQINGNLIGNDAFFDQQPYPEGWSWEDLSFYYGVEISALSFNNNAVDLTVYADEDIGEKPTIEWFPFDTDYIDFVNEQVITPPGTEYDEYYRRLLGTNTIELRSKLPKNYIEKESLSVNNAPMFFLDTFKKYLKDGGISLTGRIMVDSQRQDWTEDKYEVLAEHNSVPLKKILEKVNKNSDNFYSEMLLKTMAAEHYDVAGSTELGISLVEDFAASKKMNTTRLEMSDGSGMAPSTLMSVEDLSQLLVEMRNHPDFEHFKNSLSISGVDGSLKNRFNKLEMRGKLYGKTGYVSGVRSLSGYLEASSGQTLVFSVVTNNYTNKTSYIDYVQEEIIQTLYEKY